MLYDVDLMYSTLFNREDGQPPKKTTVLGHEGYHADPKKQVR
jgi:hypothetical protein